ncbi:cold shock domain-containing protein [Rubripirellula amarantea]|uniref:Cold-shock DNA-binding domain protein n=1 Tax=Rubripirellula amarantea TaxID=2527999 RepID=A0A5C5WT18_9BACT|nr:cold shock domain-containing protein [Rubripirellula amarantea]MDA8744476.1 cold shock domain-containing protein [Rubripirellula amarantea]TWT53295.1 Cold-shock DNA-binding domain protein [Rubripirellula amarantea]
MEDKPRPSKPVYRGAPHQRDAAPKSDLPPRPRRPKSPPPNAKTLEEIKRKFRIQRKRLGKIIALKPDSTFGFIDAEDFREDVFFHRDVWQGMETRGDRQVRINPEEGMWVEFEIDDIRFEAEGKLRATVVRPTRRPIGRKLSGRDATFNIVTHHPRARRKRPTWRE